MAAIPQKNIVSHHVQEYDAAVGAAGVIMNAKKE